MPPRDRTSKILLILFLRTFGEAGLAIGRELALLINPIPEQIGAHGRIIHPVTHLPSEMIIMAPALMTVYQKRSAIS